MATSSSTDEAEKIFGEFFEHGRRGGGGRGCGAHDWVARHAAHRPDAPALGCAEDGRTSTWAELDRRVGRIAHVLGELGVGPGDRVALVAENDPRVFEVQFAAMRLGALFVPLNWRLTVHEMAEICLDAEPAVLVHDDRTRSGTPTQGASTASIVSRSAKACAIRSRLASEISSGW